MVEENVSEGLGTGTVKPDQWPLLINSNHGQFEALKSTIDTLSNKLQCHGYL